MAFASLPSPTSDQRRVNVNVVCLVGFCFNGCSHAAVIRSTLSSPVDAPCRWQTQQDGKKILRQLLFTREEHWMQGNEDGNDVTPAYLYSSSVALQYLARPLELQPAL